MMDEAALRRPDFDETTSVPVVLGDGQAWHLPKPMLWTFIPVVRDGKATAGATGSFGPAYDALVERLDDAEEFGAKVEALFDLAIDLLRRNYDIPDDRYARLLPFRPADEANQRMWQEVLAVARGFDTQGVFSPPKA